MENRTLYVTLAVCVSLGLSFTLIEYYALRGGNPLSRLGYGIFVSLLPAFAAFVVLKLTNFFGRGAFLSTWAITALVYFLLFMLVFISKYLMD
jgi:hypothetical protein